MAESYNGYANRETWALCLWLNNDQGDQEWALDIAEEALNRVSEESMIYTGWQERKVGAALQDAFEGLCADIIEDPSMRSEATLRMLLDVGSLWRVDWTEVGSHFLPADHGR